MNLSGRTVVGEVKIKVSFDAGKGQKQTDNLNKGVGNLTRGAMNLGRGFERLGRTISITGFVMGIVARRVIGSFEGIAKSIVKISEEGANLDKAFTFLGDTLTALSLSGMLTDEVFNSIFGTFQKMMDIAMASAGPWAIINNAIQQLKNAIAEGALPQLTNLSSFLTGFDMTSFNSALSEATNIFLTPIVEKIKEMLGDEGSGIIGISEKLNAVAAIGGNFLAGVLEGFDQVMIKAAELIGDDESGIKGVAYQFGEFAAWALVLAPAGAIVGMIVGGFGSIVTAIAGVVAIIGGVATGGLLLALAAVASDWDHWSTDVIPDLLTAIGDLMNAIGGGDAEGLRKFLKGMSVGVEIIVRGIEVWIHVITTLINKLKELATWQATAQPGDTAQTFTSPIGERQGGGVIPRTGSYLMHAGERVTTRHETQNTWSPTFYISGGDPQEIARQVDRILSQRSRSPYMVR